MDKDHAFLAVGVTIAAAIGGYIFWGPSTCIKCKKKGIIIGLQNLGLTCYLNSLLQALSSCQIFVDWLNSQSHEGEVANAVKNLINILSNRSDSPSEETFVSPIEVIQALYRAGWTLMNSQQDVHELLCTLVNILEEESYKTFNDVSFNTGGNDVVINGTVSCNENANDAEYIIHQLIQNSSDISDTSQEDLRYMINNIHVSNEDVHSFKHLNGILPHESTCSASGNGGNSQSVNLRKRPHNYHEAEKPNQSPFKGFLMNRIECTKCTYRSVIRFEKFDIISLHLPEPSQEHSGIYKLTQLLDNFIKHEMINDIACEGCNKNLEKGAKPILSPAIKLLRFGRLPPCLCFHIVRTAFHEFGVYKRQDYVDFPEFIVMDPYIYKPEKNNFFRVDRTLSNLWTQTVQQQGTDPRLTGNENYLPKHTYRLSAVIIHRGSHNDGHFMTYRRGNASSHDGGTDDRWYLVSDIEVKETTLYNVLSSVAYVLFYEKCSIYRE